VTKPVAGRSGLERIPGDDLAEHVVQVAASGGVVGRALESVSERFARTDEPLDLVVEVADAVADGLVPVPVGGAGE
jgi:hypothetical protein